MTLIEAKELSLEVWRYLANHPEIKSKQELPKSLFSKISRMLNKCPLCQVFLSEDSCGACPLDCMETGGESNYDKHYNAKNTKDRKAAAKAIVGMIKAWKPEE